MAEHPPEEGIASPPELPDELAGFTLVERVAYPNGGTSSFYQYASVALPKAGDEPSAPESPAQQIALIVDDGICDQPDEQLAFDYSLITSKQNEYVARNSRVYRFLRDDLDQAQSFLQSADQEEPATVTRTADRANLADASPLEMAFEEHFANVYGSMAMPCSLHSVFQNPFYVPFGDVLRRDYKPGDWVEVDGIRERVERITEIDVASFAEKYEGFLSVEQVARDFFVNTGTVNSWIKKGKVRPTVSFEFGSRLVHMFSPQDVAAIREELSIPVHDDETIRDDFFAFLAERDYSMSYKMPFLLSFLDCMSPATGDARIDDVLDGYCAFYLDRIERGLVVDRAGCPYNAKTLADRKFVKRSMLTNPFEKFERKRFMYYSKDLGVISLNHALMARLTPDDHDAIRTQMHADLDAYYAKLSS